MDLMLKEIQARNLEHGEAIGIGKIEDAINVLRDGAGISTLYWGGYRDALSDLEKIILEMLKELR